jgi:hypothetical protein
MAMDTQRIIAWSLAIIAFVLAIFVPLSYLELRRQGRLHAPIESLGASGQPAATGAPASAAFATESAPIEPRVDSRSESSIAAMSKSRVTLGDFHLARGEYDEAIVSFGEALKIDDSNAFARKKLGLAIADCKKENAILDTDSKCGAP